MTHEDSQWTSWTTNQFVTSVKSEPGRASEDTHETKRENEERDGEEGKEGEKHAVQHSTPSCPPKLVTKLRDLGLNSALCDWILNFLTGRPQAVRMGSTTSSTLTLNTGAPQGCVLSPLLYSLFTHDCMATHSSNTIVKFADNTTVIGLITRLDDETAYRERSEVRALTSWCQDNNLHLNASANTKELIVDFRRRQREEHAPLSINGTTVERVNSFRFLGVPHQ
ncbi:hypothetical protein L3Q82_004506 [Scortum barcoo]|uniref:Uncharacterized protein n=1 Tax=Scortum barcoo TaxID=214431 RepID=A0ACB8VGL6_9TELE|nr:hypothetical protein L3Q82_004506 [Scortum barcoo]